MKEYFYTAEKLNAPATDQKVYGIVMALTGRAALTAVETEVGECHITSLRKL